MSLGFNKVCDLADFRDPELVAVMRDVAEYKLAHLAPGYPEGSEHRKDWEIAMAVRALDRFGALRPDARILGVAAGTEDTLFYLTRRAGQVFATDRYLVPGDWAPLAPPLMLVEPQALAPFAYEADRLVVQHMDGRALRYPDDSFDGIFSSGSIEHFGGLADVAMAAYEMGRVLKPGGVLALSTEFRLSGPPGGIGWPGLTLLFDEANLRRYIVEASGLELVDGLDTSASDATYASPRDLSGAVALHAKAREQAAKGPGETPEYACWEFPHVVLVHEDYVFCSIHLTLRKGEGYPAVENEWARPTESTLAAISDYNRSVATRQADGGAPDRAGVPATGVNGPGPAGPAGPVQPQLVGSWDEIRTSVDQRRGRLAEIDRALDSHGQDRMARVATLDRVLLEIDEARDDVDRGLASVALAHRNLDARLAEPDLVTASMATADASSWSPHRVALPEGVQFTVVLDDNAPDPLTRTLATGYTLDGFLISLMLQLVQPGDRVLDLGAHVGTFSLAAAAVGCKVIAVEASPTNAGLLRAGASRNGFHDVYVVNAVVSDGPGSVDFLADGPWGHVAWADPDGSRRDTVKVPSITVDALLAELGWDTASFVKIDVEGSEIAHPHRHAAPPRTTRRPARALRVERAHAGPGRGHPRAARRRLRRRRLHQLPGGVPAPDPGHRRRPAAADHRRLPGGQAAAPRTGRLDRRAGDDGVRPGGAGAGRLPPHEPRPPGLHGPGPGPVRPVRPGPSRDRRGARRARPRPGRRRPDGGRMVAAGRGPRCLPARCRRIAIVTMTSYAQNHEDVLLDRVFPRGIPGFYIDIGANDPVRDSVTKHFYDLGWRGVNVEPGTHPFELLSAARERDVNLNVGVSDEPGELTFFEYPPELSGASTFSAEQAARHRDSGFASVERKVPTITLAQLCEEHVTGPIDFLSIDVEGLERQVIAGGDWTRWRPRVVVVEATLPATTVPTHEEWEPLLLAADYVFAAFDGLNRYYVASEDGSEHARLAAVLAVPVNVTDNYQPYGLSKQIQELRWGLEATASQLAAARAANGMLLAQYHGFAGELTLLRAQLEKVERALTNSRATCENLREAALEPSPLLEQLRAEVADARGRTEAAHALFEAVGPAGLGVARRLSSVALRHPKGTSSLKRVLRIGLRLRRMAAGKP